MIIRDHLIDDVIHRPTNNRTEGTMTPKFIVIHSSQTYNIEQAWNREDAIKTCAHIQIDVTGEVYQRCFLAEKAYHCGQSYWQGHYGLNSCSIGIELINRGKSIHQVMDAVKIGDFWWYRFSHEQLNALDELIPEIVNIYKIRDIVRHSDVSPREVDPGPLFPMERYRPYVDLGNANSAGRYVVTCHHQMPVYVGPGAHFETYKYLLGGDGVTVLRFKEDWAFISYMPKGSPESLTGWAHESFLKRA